MSKKKQIDIELAIRLYRDEKKSSPEVSRIVGCSVQTLLCHLRDAGVVIRGSSDLKIKVDFETLRYEYEDLKMSTIEIADKHSMSPVSVWQRLYRHGIKMRNREESCTNRKIPTSEYQIICDYYQKNKDKNCSDIAKDYGVHSSTISNILKQNGIVVDRTGPRSKTYKGGITPLHTRIRNCEKSEFWRRACMERDEYKCRITGKTGQLHVHHYPVSFSKLFNAFLSLHQNLNPINDSDKLFELAQEYQPFWDIDNGMTVSETMHDRLHSNNGITDEELIELHDKGWSCQRISKHFGKSLSFVRSRFLAIGQSRRPPGSYSGGRNPITKEIESGVLESYLKGETTRTIINRYHISSSTMYNILKNNNIMPGNRRRSTESIARQQSDRVRQLNSYGVTVQEMARMYDVSDTTIRNILKEAN